MSASAWPTIYRYTAGNVGIPLRGGQRIVRLLLRTSFNAICSSFKKRNGSRQQPKFGKRGKRQSPTSLFTVYCFKVNIFLFLFNTGSVTVAATELERQVDLLFSNPEINFFKIQLTNSFFVHFLDFFGQLRTEMCRNCTTSAPRTQQDLEECWQWNQ